MPLFDSTGRDLERVFELTPSNKGSFEIALRRALATLLGDHVSLAGARMVFIRDAPGFIAAVKSLRPRRLIYYGHAILETKVLLPSLGKSITTWQLLNALKGVDGHKNPRKSDPQDSGGHLAFLGGVT
jgi:hypothetical protein